MGPHRRRSPQKFYGFHSFAESGFSGVFRDNIRQFLRQCAEPEDYVLEGMPRIWCTFLVYESRGTVLPLYTVEEDVMRSDRPFCDYCRCAGWSHHFVTKRKYHMIIPANDEWNKFLDEGVFDLQTHLLHGLIHSNGFGHLICINGIEGGSKYICGKEIMDLWDRICTALHARQISVEDLSRKRKMDLRLLHGVAYGHSWFGKWGYRFCHGSFGVKDHNYERAMDVLGSLKLDQVIRDFSLTNGCTMVKQMIDFYRQKTNADLITVRDLFRLVLSLKPPVSPITFSPTFPSWPGKKLCTTDPLRLSLECSSMLQSRSPPFRKEKPSKCRKFSTLAANMDSRWPVRRLEHVAVVIVDALKEKKAASKDGNCGMTRQEARDAARLHIGDTGLIDHVLKVMNNVIIGNYVVRRAVNRSTKVLEYTLQDLKGSKGAPAAYLPMRAFTICPGRSISSDIAYLYRNLLLGYPVNMVKFAAQVILYSKHFVKEWPFRDEEDDSLRFMCRLKLTSVDTITGVSFDTLPREYIAVPLYATVGDLKAAVQKAMRETYCVMERLQVTDILEMEGLQDEEVLFSNVESGRELCMRCCGIDMDSSLRFQGGNENWTVKCKCGARDDDGERMVACDICETWQHTRCSGIQDSEGVPRLFICDECCSSLAPPKVECSFMYNDCEFMSNDCAAMLLPQMNEGGAACCTLN